ncbi:hypothetical protein DUNSADRAFT_18374, partial [Dunaliella salina]
MPAHAATPSPTDSPPPAPLQVPLPAALPFPPSPAPTSSRLPTNPGQVAIDRFEPSRLNCSVQAILVPHVATVNTRRVDFSWKLHQDAESFCNA